MSHLIVLFYKFLPTFFTTPSSTNWMKKLKGPFLKSYWSPNLKYKNSFFTCAAIKEQLVLAPTLKVSEYRQSKFLNEAIVHWLSFFSSYFTDLIYVWDPYLYDYSSGCFCENSWKDCSTQISGHSSAYFEEEISRFPMTWHLKPPDIQ